MLEINNTLVEMKNACHRFNNTLDTAEEKKNLIYKYLISRILKYEKQKTKKYKTICNNYGTTTKGATNTLWGYWRRDKGQKITFEAINFPRLMSDTKQNKKVQRTPTIHDRF